VWERALSTHTFKFPAPLSFRTAALRARERDIIVRLDDACGGGYRITPTDACFGFLDPSLDGSSRESRSTNSW
jgi:hypothetical protein